MYFVCADALCEQSHGTSWQTDEINWIFSAEKTWSDWSKRNRSLHLQNYVTFAEM